MLKKIPFKNDFEDIDGLLKTSKIEFPKIVYVSNPNNPMGTLNKKVEMKKFISEVPK